MKINTIKSPFNYHRCTGQQDWVHPYFVYPSPPPTSSNLHSAKLRPPTEDPPTTCWLGKPLLFFLLSMNLAPLSTFYERDCAVIVGCDWLTFSTVCRGPPCCVYKRFCSFRGAEACVQTQRSICLSHSSAPFGFYLSVDLFFHCVHIAHVAYPSSASGGLGCHKFERLQIFLVWKWLCTCLFQTLFLSFGQMPRDSLVWSYCNCTFNFSMECNIDFYSGSVVLYSYELCISASSP